MGILGLAEKLSRGKILRRKLPPEFGGHTLFVTPEGGLRYWKRSLNYIDPMLFNVVREYIKSSDIVWDVGANVGLFTFAAAAKASEGRCLSFEPDVWLCTLLHRSIKQNPGMRVDVLPVAVSDKVALAELNITVRSRSTNYLSYAEGSTQTGGVREVQLVPTVTLDFILGNYEAPSFIKIDTEGAEQFVLQGASEILRTIKPTILCEVALANYAEVSARLIENDYMLYDADRLPEKSPSSKGVSNILAIPPKLRT